MNLQIQKKLYTDFLTCADSDRRRLLAQALALHMIVDRLHGPLNEIVPYARAARSLILIDEGYVPFVDADRERLAIVLELGDLAGLK